MDRKSMPNFFKFNFWFASVLFTGLLSVLFLKPVNGQVIASFSGIQDFLLTDNDQFQTVFVLESSKEFYDLFVSRALDMPETLTFKSSKVKKNQYRCSIHFLHPTDAYYVKKTLLNLGIEQLRINNYIFSLPDYEPETK